MLQIGQIYEAQNQEFYMRVNKELHQGAFQATFHIKLDGKTEIIATEVITEDFIKEENLTLIQIEIAV